MTNDKKTDYSNRRCIIVAGASIEDYALLIKRLGLSGDDYFIYCDSGLRHAEALGFAPDLIIGDFDSFELEEAQKKADANQQESIIILPTEKDDTDSVFAAKKAIEVGFGRVTLIGAVGDRFDHSLANIGILKMLADAGLQAEIADDHSIMAVIQSKTLGAPGMNSAMTHVDDTFSYFSLLAVFGEARGVSISGAKYLLNHADISASYPYAVSNEPLTGGSKITVKDGSLLIIKVF